MTTQTRKFIELADILGMRFDCKKCHASLSLPPENSPRPPRDCPNCGSNWTEMPDGNDHKDDFKVLVDAIAAVSRLHLGCAFTLEIKPEPNQAISSSSFNSQT
jgi:hypothetical protein